MTGGELMVLGKLALTFGVLLGLPVIDLWMMRRHARSESRQVQAGNGD